MDLIVYSNDQVVKDIFSGTLDIGGITSTSDPFKIEAPSIELEATTGNILLNGGDTVIDNTQELKVKTISTEAGDRLELNPTTNPVNINGDGQVDGDLALYSDGLYLPNLDLTSGRTLLNHYEEINIPTCFFTNVNSHPAFQVSMCRIGIIVHLTPFGAYSTPATVTGAGIVQLSFTAGGPGMPSRFIPGISTHYLLSDSNSGTPRLMEIETGTGLIKIYADEAKTPFIGGEILNFNIQNFTWLRNIP